QTKAWIEKYFGEIPARPLPQVPAPPPVVLDSTKKLYHEDNFARLPQLTLAWPTVPLFHEDSYALDVLAAVLADGKSTPFYKVIVKEAQLTPIELRGNSSQEQECRFSIPHREYAGKDQDVVQAAVEAACARFEPE